MGKTAKYVLNLIDVILGSGEREKCFEWAQGDPSPLTKRTCIVIVEVDLDGQRTVMGVLADAVSQVMDLTPVDIEAPPTFGTAVKVDYLQGMGKVGKKFVLLLDVDRILAAPELQAAEAAATGPEGEGRLAEVDGRG